MKRPQRGGCMHPGIDQHENRDDHAMLVLFEEIQSEINQRQEHEVGEESIGVAQKQHEDAPVVLVGVELPGSAERPRARSVYANGATVGATTRTPSQRIPPPWHCGHANSSQNRLYRTQTATLWCAPETVGSPEYTGCNQRLRTCLIGRCGHHSVAVRLC
jgi:hypothetical protein